MGGCGEGRWEGVEREGRRVCEGIMVGGVRV